MKLKLVSIAFVLVGLVAKGQGSKFIEIGVGIGSNSTSPTVSFQKDWFLVKKEKFVIGKGLRYTGFLGNEVYLTSAPNALAIEPSSVDSLFAPKPSIHAVNVLINLAYNLSPKFQVGFNIDAVGLSFGPTGSPEFISNGRRTQTDASPTSPNVLLVGNNDIGSLNSLFHLGYKFTDKIGVRLAYQFLFNELTTETPVQTIPEPNDRFRVKSGQVYIGLNLNF